MLLFDFDGVLADSLQIYADVCTRAARRQGYQKDLEPNPFAALERVTFETLAETLGLCPTTFTADACALLDQQTESAPAFEGIRDTLTAISTHMPVGILSASPGGFIARFLEENHVADRVSLVLSRDDPGTKAEKIIAVMQQGRYRPIALVGDGVSDIAAATTAGIASIGVAWGWQSPEKLLAAGADFIAETPARLSGILSQIQR